MREVAEAFESLLLQHLVTRMRESNLESGLFGKSAGSSVYEGMFDQHIAQSLSSNSPLGIADMLEKSWMERQADAGQVADVLRDLTQAGARQTYAALGHAAPAGRGFPGPPALPDEISREFGWGVDPINGKERFHEGVDLPAPSGTPVLALSRGVVTSVGTRGGYGLEVLVEHAGGFTARYAHLSGSDVQVGQQLQQGQQLGRVGSSGRSTGPHLHLETIQNGQKVNPGAFAEKPFSPKVFGSLADE